MSDLQVEIVRLAPMQVASFYGFGAEPEAAAAAKLLAWAGPRGLLDGGVAHRIFGFNNPSPSAGSPHYGYEFWLELKEDDLAALAALAAADSAGARGAGAASGAANDAVEGVELKSFAGGRFAVARCRGVAAIPDTWRALVTYLEDSRYTMTGGQCLEQHTGRLDDIEALDFALYQVIAE
jgi:DNA gyrase inhibitor GyrI